MDARLATRMRENGCYIKSLCDLCGKWYESETFEVELFDTDVPNGNHMDVCPDCVKAGQIGASQRMLEHAGRLEDYAKWLREYAPAVASIRAEEWVTTEQVKAANDKFDADRAREDSFADVPEGVAVGVEGVDWF